MTPAVASVSFQSQSHAAFNAHLCEHTPRCCQRALIPSRCQPNVRHAACADEPRPLAQIWSLDDRAYVDTLFGHQADVLGVDARRAERVLTVGADHTCRVWKIPEESQLIYRCVIRCCLQLRADLPE